MALRRASSQRFRRIRLLLSILVTKVCDPWVYSKQDTYSWLVIAYLSLLCKSLHMGCKSAIQNLCNQHIRKGNLQSLSSNVGRKRAVDKLAEIRTAILNLGSISSLWNSGSSEALPEFD